jgi:hypothetical protein
MVTVGGVVSRRSGTDTYVMPPSLVAWQKAVSIKSVVYVAE